MKSVVQVLDELRIPHSESHHHSRIGWVQINCPFCSRTGHFRMGINKAGAYCSCWSCGGKRLVDVLMEITGRSYRDIQDVLQGIQKERSKRQQVKLGKLKIPDGVGELQRPHKKYLKERGFDWKEIQKLWGVEGIGLAPYLQWRLFIPITVLGETVSWTTRSIGNGKRSKYITASPEQESMFHKNLLYGEDYAQHSIIVHEGPLDVWAMGPGAVATLGLEYSRAQLHKMSTYPVRVICFDSEPEAQKRAKRLATELQAFPGETVVIELETGNDPAEADKSEIIKIRKSFLV